jgi:hypothetical protein
MLSPILHDLLYILVENATCGGGSSVVKRIILVGMEAFLEELYCLRSLWARLLRLICLRVVESFLLLGVESSV